MTPVLTALEVVMDVLIPWVTASLIDKGINAGNMENVYRYGGLMLLMAFVSLALGIMAGRSSAVASTGFAANLRSAMYRNIQRFAFSDIDKYSTAGLVTRMTTDVQNLQQAFQQILRVTVRAPFRLVLSVVMCLVIDPRLSLIFIVAMVVLGVSLWQIISRVSKLFQQVFEKYDALNESVGENVAGIRVVKAFVREKFENEKFARAAEGLYKLYVRAESLMALNHPVMNMVVYGCMIALSWWGAHFIVGGTLTTGELTSLFTYVMSILQALMMLSMIFVMLTQSAASAKRVTEVINEEPDIVNPENPVMEVADGSLEFQGVRFDYRPTPQPLPCREGSEMPNQVESLEECQAERVSTPLLSRATGVFRAATDVAAAPQRGANPSFATEGGQGGGSAGAVPPLFRPPHGWLRHSVYYWLSKEFRIVMWDLVTRDYSKWLTADDVFENVRRYARNGSIITFHDSLKSIDKLHTALPRSIEWLQEQGYEFRTF